jgi:preprotein translocase subunit SecG
VRKKGVFFVVFSAFCRVFALPVVFGKDSFAPRSEKIIRACTLSLALAFLLIIIVLSFVLKSDHNRAQLSAALRVTTLILV